MRGFACLSREQRRENARKGGKKAWAIGQAHRWSSDEAKLAGHRGGKAAHGLPITNWRIAFRPRYLDVKGTA